MEEKKLTDEEIVKALECCAVEPCEDCGNCPRFTKEKLCHKANAKQSLDLIHRLQSENEKLKPKKILANRVYSDATLKGWKKEDLIEQIRILEHNWAAAEETLNNSSKNAKKLLAEQKAEIERLAMLLQTLETVLKEKEELLEKGVEEAYADFMRRYRSAEDDIKTLVEINVELETQVEEYQDKIERGTLKELPCKVGDTVYVRGNTWDYYKSFYNQEFIGTEFFVVGKITSIRITDKQILIKVKATYRGNQRLYKKKDYPISAIGKTVFLTREEAEKRLLELQ